MLYRKTILKYVKNVLLGSAIVTKASAGIVATTFVAEDPSVWQKVRREIESRGAGNAVLPDKIDDMLAGLTAGEEDLSVAMRLSYAAVAPRDIGRVDRFWLLHPRVQSDPEVRRAFLKLKSSMFQMGVLSRNYDANPSIILASKSGGSDDDDDSGGYDS